MIAEVILRIHNNGAVEITGWGVFMLAVILMTIAYLRP